ncbi:TetR family transcriptional regulator C-terminal domain-containing protein [Corynebacterium imitans]|uniref:TetR family transcriptional regulator C-terminal domain-containing protein n=1 Tax=Corynebacterium imitans TaxID=156978 RepID=UPI00254AD755|nr:TetR family transcriptional regulator C-terminal domain-containing protein [Corynebacterium imitans]MDK8637609.1 TetR family transcriptional regulator C-terminal domain-containing protein [Corynebacterium imitans]MDK8772910.1 TetR family transcriptional regulator C-terminal domain-containing protein [Corynebacterium imitans]
MTSAQPRNAARAAIAAAGLRHRDVAAHLGIDASKLSKSLSGVRRFSATELARLAALTGVDAQSLATVSEPGTSTRDRARQTRKRAIVAAAWPLFTQRGYQAVTVADIATAADLSPSAVHYYFPSKNEIFLATLDECSRQGAKRRARAHTLATPTERLSALFAIQLDGSPESRQEWATWAQFWSSSAAFADAHQATEIAYARWQQELLPIVEEGMASGEFVSGDPQVMIASLTALIDGLGVRLLAGALDPLSIHEIFSASVRGWMASSDSGGPPIASTPSAGNDQDERTV